MGWVWVSQWYAWAPPLTQIAKIIWEAMSISLGFWEWGMSKTRECLYHCNGHAPPVFKEKAPGNNCPRGDHNWRIIRSENKVENKANEKKVTSKEFAPIDLSQTGPKPVENSGTKSKSEGKKHNYGIYTIHNSALLFASSLILFSLLNLKMWRDPFK